MYRLHIRDYSSEYGTHKWWQNFSKVVRQAGVSNIEEYIWTNHHGVYRPGAHNLVWEVEFESEEDALAFKLKYS